jgi:hypothetical protein
MGQRRSATTHLYVASVPTLVNRSLLVALFACALFVSVGTVAGAPGGSAFPQQDIDPDDVLMSITVEEDGDAVWVIEYRTRLETDEDEQAFEALRSDVAADPEPYAERFRDRMDATAASAENATGREMAISEMAVSAENRTLPQEYGVLTYRFRWSNFGAVEGDGLLVGDAIDGLFLDAETALLLSWPDDYELLDASPTPTETRDGAVAYDGPMDFARGEPRIELAPADDAGPGDGEPSGTDGSLPVSPLSVAAITVLLLVALGAFAVYRRQSSGSGTDHADGGTDGGSAGGTTAPPDEELLSNEEQVLRLIEAEGGRMKQKEVAERLDWTDAKTSQVTKKLRESGELDGFRLGRENVLSLPDEGADSGSE